MLFRFAADTKVEKDGYGVRLIELAYAVVRWLELIFSLVEKEQVFCILWTEINGRINR